MIEIELTESVLMDITQQHNDRFERLRQLGIRIAIDDFGTGYSSLSYLANYPINRMKIAQELVFGVDSDSRSATVVRAPIRLATNSASKSSPKAWRRRARQSFCCPPAASTARVITTAARSAPSAQPSSCAQERSGRRAARCGW